MYKILTRPPPGKYLSFLSYDQLSAYANVDINDLRNNNLMYKRKIQQRYEEYGLGIEEIPHCVTENIYNQVVALTNRVIKILGFGRRPDIDNMFLTVSDPGTGKYNIDIWTVDLITKNLEKKFHLNIGNWNVVNRNDYIMFASNITINFFKIPRRDQLTLSIFNSPNLTFKDAIKYIGLKIDISSFVKGYNVDCERLSFEISGSWHIHYNKVDFHNYLSGRHVRRSHIAFGDDWSDDN